jgi:AmmeMemoRadiSam system protein B
MFYPENPGELKRTVTGLLENARQIEVPHPKALIVPHAGYIYSGPIAASAYALLKKQRGTIRRVILMGPAHRVYLKGLALPGTYRFAIHGGEIPLDI